MVKNILSLFSACFFSLSGIAQLHWVNVDAAYQPLPPSIHVYTSTSPLEGKPNIAYYITADLKDPDIEFTVDTTRNRRLTPGAFYEKNDHPVLVVNCTFFSFETNRSLNTVIRNKNLLAYNVHAVAGRGKDSLQYLHYFRSGIGINRKRQADIAWIFSDSLSKFAYASQQAISPLKDSVKSHELKFYQQYVLSNKGPKHSVLKKWKMETAVGGGPVLIQEGKIHITNEEEKMFTGKAINDKHPRTAMGYTKDNILVILVVQGRQPGLAEGATLLQEAALLKDLGCEEALNLDGGGSSCMLINGKETIRPSDKEGQRAVPAVFIIKSKEK
ncbi:MAG: hypothetical protein GC171_07455 [Terrimonas sp.]|nr:hypothetical protein [Terrimonas sp.]